MKKRFAKWFSVLVVGTMILSGGVALAADADFDNYTVESIDPAGTVINLFDYWAADVRDAPDNVTYDVTIDQAGINEGHVFKFGSGMGDDSNVFTGGSINAWTENENPRTGIVSNMLGTDGYPQLNAGCKANVQSKHPNGNVLFSKDYNTNNETEKSLAYLFNTDNGAGKQAFSNVGGLLQVDKDGYYYYDSTKNYAWFDETAKKFKLYDTWGVKAGGASGSDGQFFPFNGPDDVFELDTSTELKQREEVTSTSENINHYFGLTMSTRFVQKNDGKTYNDDKPITYEFSGDDDVWVFIDNVLVADLGGIHDKASLSINFSTGVIKINDKRTGTIKNVFEAAGRTSKWGYGETADTFANDTYHTLKFFYLERGNTDSNMSLKYNLMPIPESRITKVDQNGAPMTGVGFELYPADEDVEDVDSVDLIYSGTTGADGTLRILDDAGLPLTFKEFYEEYNTEYFVLKENVPEGYRGSPETYLKYEPKTGLILADGYWGTGSYASPQVTTTATNALYNDTGGVQGDEIIDLTDVEDLEDIEIFAVLFKRLDMNEPHDDEGNWAPISGSIEKGWTVHDGSSVSMLERVSEAIDANMKAGIDNSFKLTSGGAFQVTIEDLPGDIKSYYWYLDQQQSSDFNSARYTANYYLMRESEPVRLYTDEFTREFSTNVYVSNIKDQLVVEKTDETDNKMNDATFSLYKAKDVDGEGIIDENGTVNLDALNNSSIEPYDTGTTATLTGTEGDMTAGISGDGLLIFPTEDVRPLMKGNYYLIETKSGSVNYSVNPKAVKVVVDESGVHVDAGTEDDGISTRLDVGHVLKSMFHFVPDTGIDATLNNIKTQLLTAESYPSEGLEAPWSNWEESPGDGQEGHLEYVGKYSGSGYYGVEYKPVEGTIPLDTTTSAGWSKLAIRQCLTHGVIQSRGTGTETESVLYTKKGSLRQDLKDQDISHLFSTITYVTVENRPDIEVRKVWNDNNNKHKNRPESVTVKLLADGVDTENTLVLNEGNNWTGNFTNIPVKNDGIPVNYTIKEVNVAGYDSEITGDVATGFTITNTLKTVNISGTKTWNDNENQDGKRPDSITIHLLADGKEVSDKQMTVTENEDLKWTFVGLPKYADGEEITYTITEDAVTDYTTTYDGYNVTNSYTPGKTSVTVTKTWDDGNNQDGKRPNSVTVELLADGEKKGKTLELSEGNSWTGTFTGLDEKKDGEVIEYSVKEESIPEGYTSEVTKDEYSGVFTITNSYTPETISISGIKTWEDNNDRAGKRPDSITIRLLADGKELLNKRTTVEPDADGNWQWTFDGLPKYSDGKEIVYSVAEEKVPNYTAKVNGFSITNTYSPDTPVGPDDPDDPPVGPVDPDDPDDPDDPPVGPVDPDDPDDPDDPPVGPVDPDDPDYPTFPEGPDEPGIPGYNGKVDDAVKTGDETMIGLWLALMGIGAAGTLAGIFSRRKKEEKN